MKLAKITSVIRSRIIIHTYSGWINDNLSVLDIGCGTGVVSQELMKTFSFSKLVGCDIENYLLTDIPFIKLKSLNKLPFNNKAFDVAMFNDVLHHTSFNNQEALISDSLRVAATAFIFELNPTWLGKMLDFLINKIHNPRMNIPFTYRTPAGWQNIFKKMGLKYEIKNVKSPFWYPFRHIAYKIAPKRTLNFSRQNRPS